ncbi:MAG: glycosyltransferase family 9 protein [Nitrospira sp.]|nr:glycosyltransferase family 9 protein [Nitrospira sp.]
MNKQVLIINITRMGDLIQMVPLLSRLEEEWPGVAIDLIVDKEFAHVAGLIPGIRQVLMFDFQLLMDESRVRARDLVALYRELAGWVQPLLQVGYDRVVNLTFNRRSAFLVKYFGCADERGMTTTQDGSFVVKNPWMKYFVDFHVYRQLNRFNIVDLFSLGGSGPGSFYPLRLSVPQHMKEWARTFVRQAGTGDEWIGIQVGASDAMKAWRPEYFGHMMACLSQRQPVGFVLIGTKKEEADVQEAIRCYRQAGGLGNICEAVGQTTVPQLVALLEHCVLMVTNDTGPMHMAVGVNTPVLNVSVGHVDFWETGPFGPGHWVVQPEIMCGPCGFDKVCPHHACKDQIIPLEVAELCLHLLGKRPFPSFSSKIRVYESGVNEDQLGKFMIRAGTEEPRVAWYAEYWRQYWYESFTGNPSLVPFFPTPPSDFSDCEQVWRRLAPQLDQLCIQADTVLDMCRQRPIPVNRLKASQYQLKVDTLTMQQIARSSLAFGPLAMAFFRDIFSLESLTLSGMAEEHARAYHVFRARGEENYRRLKEMNSHDSRGALYARAIG